jgi:hypothetical protein
VNGSDAAGADLYQVLPWPPRGAALRCGAGFGRSLIGIRGRVCQAPPSPLRTVSVAHLDDAVLGTLVNVPGGVAVMAISSARGVPIYRLVIRRFGMTRIVDIPTTEPQAEELSAHFGYPTLHIDWPQIDVEARSPSGATAEWYSRDGGATWTVSWPQVVGR